MKKFEEILEEIKKASGSLAELKKENRERISRYRILLDEKTFKERCDYMAEHEAEVKENNARIAVLEEKIQDKEIEIKILQNNARIALFHEVSPVVLEVLSKYKNKPHGEKTKKKIADEIKGKTGYYFYLKGSHSFCIYLEYGSYDIEVGTKHTREGQKSILIDNKIQIVSMEDLEIWYSGRIYHEDIQKVISELKQLHKEAKQKQEELEKICSKFNHLAVDGIQNIDAHKHIYSTLI